MVAFLDGHDGGTSWQRPVVGGVEGQCGFSEDDKFSFACLARDHEGQVVNVISSCRDGVLSSELAKAVGVRDALSWIKSKNWQNVVLETDCLILVQGIRCNIFIVFVK